MIRHLNISVIICTHTEARWASLVQAVESLRQQSVTVYEIIVVIDQNPALAERVRQTLPDTTVVECRVGHGTSAARNCGIAVAQGAVIAFLDDDAIAAPDWLEQLLAGYAGEHVLGVGGAIVPLWEGRRPGWFPEEFDWVVGCTYRGMPEASAPVRNLIGCNMSFRRDVFDSIGGFRTEIGRVGAQPYGCDETELCIRLRQHWPGAELRFEPRARVLHQVPASRASWRYFRARCYLEGRSKALVARLVGAGDASSTERIYVLRTLPHGMVRGLSDAVRRRDSAGLVRAGAIAAGLAVTTAGYLQGIAIGFLSGWPSLAPAPPVGVPHPPSRESQHEVPV
jgi:GT2 family glycosyltransferase